MRVGQSVEFRNSEDSPHNVNVNRMPTGTALFNTSTAPYEKFVYTFEQPGQYSVTCDIHPGMLATLVATTTPYVAVADDLGAFAIQRSGPGAYKLVWMARGRSGERIVDVPATGAVAVQPSRLLRERGRCSQRAEPLPVVHRASSVTLLAKCTQQTAPPS